MLVILSWGQVFEDQLHVSNPKSYPGIEVIRGKNRYGVTYKVASSTTIVELTGVGVMVPMRVVAAEMTGGKS